MRFQLFRTDEGDRTRAERGQAMVEVALLLPFVFILLMMVIEFGFLMWSNLNVNASAREAARFAAVGHIAGEVDDDSDLLCGGTLVPEVSTVRGRAVQASLSRVVCSEVAVKYHNAETAKDAVSNTYSRGDVVKVRIVHPYTWLTPMGAMMTAFGWGGPGGDGLLLNACAQARLESEYQASNVYPLANEDPVGCAG